MPLERCQFCTARPREETAVLRWRADSDERERLTLQLCTRHLERMQRATITRGWPHQGWLHKIGWW